MFAKLLISAVKSLCGSHPLIFFSLSNQESHFFISGYICRELNSPSGASVQRKRQEEEEEEEQEEEEDEGGVGGRKDCERMKT